jgi:hypothetical protein
MHWPEAAWFALAGQKMLRDFSRFHSLVFAKTTRSHLMAWTEITRPKYQRDELGYASDTTDEEWALIEPHIPPPGGASVVSHQVV